MTEMVLLDDPRIRQVDCENRPEKMVSMRGIHKNILIDETRSRIENDSPFFCYMREDAALRLVRAAEKLPEGWQFLIKKFTALRPSRKNVLMITMKNVRRIIRNQKKTNSTE